MMAKNVRKQIIVIAISVVVLIVFTLLTIVFTTQDANNPRLSNAPLEAEATATTPSQPPSARSQQNDLGDTASAIEMDLDLISDDPGLVIRPITWSKPVYGGSTSLSPLDHQDVVRLVKGYDRNFQRIKSLTFHEEEQTYPIGESQWAQKNVFSSGARFTSLPTSIDVTFSREPLFFNIKGTTRSGSKMDLKVTPVGELGTETRGESWRAMYMDGDDPSFRDSYLLEHGAEVHRNVQMNLTLPHIGNIAEQHNFQNDTFTVVETHVTDWWESLGDSHSNIPAKETVWFNNRTGMPQLVLREITDPKYASKMDNPYTTVQIMEYAEVDGVYYPKRTRWIGKGYQIERDTKRANIVLNGVSIE